MRRSTFSIVLVGLAVALVGALVVGALAQSTSSEADPPVIDHLTEVKLHAIGLQGELELVRSRLAVCEGQTAPERYKAAMATLEQAARTVVQAWEAEHPGWTLDPRTKRVQRK